MSQMQKIAPFAGSIAICMLTNSCAKSRWIFSSIKELLIVCCCSSQVHGGKPSVFCRARHEETRSNRAVGKVASTSYDGMEDALKQEDAQPDVSLATLSKAWPQGVVLSKSSASPSQSGTSQAEEVFSAKCDKPHVSIKILQSHFGYLCLTHILIMWKYKCAYPNILEWYIINLTRQRHL